MFIKRVRHNEITFTIRAPSRNPLKKYDVYQGKTFITSFGGVSADSSNDIQIGFHTVSEEHTPHSSTSNKRCRRGQQRHIGSSHT